MSNVDIIMLVGGAIAAVLGLVDVIRSSWQSLSAMGVAILGIVFVLVALA